MYEIYGFFDKRVIKIFRFYSKTFLVNLLYGLRKSMKYKMQILNYLRKHILNKKQHFCKIFLKFLLSNFRHL